jgi:hypothetical protein
MGIFSAKGRVTDKQRGLTFKGGQVEREKKGNKTYIGTDWMEGG